MNNEQVIRAAVKAGKFSLSRAKHYRRLMKADPVGTRQLIASLASGLGGPVATRAPTAYPKQWISAASEARKQSGPVTFAND